MSDAVEKDMKVYIDELSQTIEDPRRQAVMYLGHELETHLKSTDGVLTRDKTDFVFLVPIDADMSSKWYDYVNPLHDVIQQMPDDQELLVFLIQTTWGENNKVEVLCAFAPPAEAPPTA